MSETEKHRKAYATLEKRLHRAAGRHAERGTVAGKKHLGKIVLTAQKPWDDRDLRYEFRDRHDDDYGYTALRVFDRDECAWADFDTVSKLLILEGLDAAAAAGTVAGSKRDSQTHDGANAASEIRLAH